MITDVGNAYEHEALMLKVLGYFKSLHELNLFHGDIKTDNIFYEKPSPDDLWEIKEISIDAGSILWMKRQFDTNIENNFVSTVTPGYSSIGFTKKWRALLPFTFKELIVEDLHQLKMTIKNLCRLRKRNGDKDEDHLISKAIFEKLDAQEQYLPLRDKEIQSYDKKSSEIASLFKKSLPDIE